MTGRPKGQCAMTGDIEVDRNTRAGEEGPITTPPPPPRELSRPRELLFLALLAVAAIFLYGIGIASVGYMGTDERRYSQVAHEVGPGPDFFVLRFLGELYPDKPPLLFWAQALSYRVIGNTSPFAARVPLFLMALAALAFAYLAMRRIDGPRVALLGTALLMIAFRFYWSGKQVRLDTPMCAFTFGAFWATTQLLFPDPGRRASAFWAAVAWTMAGLTILAKGPGAIVWVLTILGFAAVTRSWAPLVRHRPWWGIPLMLVIVGAWFVPAAMFGGREYIGPMLGDHVVNRFTGLIRHEQNPLYFLYKLPSDALPFGLMIPAAVIWGFIGPRRKSDGGRTAFALCWLLIGLVFFSIPQGKRGQYILPLYPPAALLAARFVLDGLDNWRAPLGRALKWHLYLFSLLLLLCVPAIIALRAFRRDKLEIEEILVPDVYIVAILTILLLAGVFSAMLLRMRRPGRAFAVHCAGFCAIYILLFASFLPRYITDELPRKVAAAANQRIAAGEGVAFHRMGAEAALYTDPLPSFINGYPEIFAFMAVEQPRWIFMTRRNLDKLYAAPGDPGWRGGAQCNHPPGRGYVALPTTRAYPPQPYVLF